MPKTPSPLMKNTPGPITPQHSGVRTPMSTDGLISTIKRHLAIVRQDPEFVSYIISLALYLQEVNDGQIAIEEVEEPRQGEPVRAAVGGMKRLAEKAPVREDGVCRLCGAPTKGKRMCPSCGHMVG